MGRVLFALGHPPILWHATFSTDIQPCIVSIKNTSGDHTNSDLEQAGVLAQADMAASLYDLQELTLTTLNDNTTTITWNQKGAITSDQAAAYLCCLSSLHHWHHHYYHDVSHIQGTVNEMADILSHHHDLLDMHLFTLFNTCFPQDIPWHMCHLQSMMLLALNSSL